jgi:hypothetical protein
MDQPVTEETLEEREARWAEEDRHADDVLQAWKESRGEPDWADYYAHQE